MATVPHTDTLENYSTSLSALGMEQCPYRCAPFKLSAPFNGRIIAH